MFLGILAVVILMSTFLALVGIIVLGTVGWIMELRDKHRSKEAHHD